MSTNKQTLANAIRVLAMDAVQQANSGHPGMPMGMADIAEVLWNDFLQHDPKHPEWLNRDRFILSNGHGSMLHYALLHLSGYDLSIEDLKQFRQLHSKTPGHPEYGYTPGVETTTGPLGQGFANAVGMALAERTLAATFNRPGFSLINHHTYVFMGDGCLMEGISHEAASFAGTQKLGKLIAFWDDNGISIDGEVKAWFSDDTPARFRAYGWHVIDEVDGHNRDAIAKAIQLAQKMNDRPSLICCNTTIGFGAPHVAGTAHCHGSPLGAEEIAAARAHLKWGYPAFVIPEEIYHAWNACEKGSQRKSAWQTLFTQYSKAHPELACELTRRMQKQLPEQWSSFINEKLVTFQKETKAVATRKASQQCLNAFAPLLPELLGGSADLTGSNCTQWQNAKPLLPEQADGQYIFYGVREFGMSAIMNGLALYGGFIPFGGTFLTFVDYARNAVRMAALMKQRVIFVYTHDSIGLGEDGPTHQPIEHAALLRLTPNVAVWRPCDLSETLVAWQAAIEQQQGPSCLLLSRQNLPPMPRDAATLDNIARGGYILRDCKNPKVILIATGSEVGLAMQAAEKCDHIRVVSMPSTSVFDQQPAAYREQVLPPHISKRIAIEMGSKDFWYKYVGLSGRIIGLDRFGESAPDQVLFNFFGFTVENVIATINELNAH